MCTSLSFLFHCSLFSISVLVKPREDSFVDIASIETDEVTPQVTDTKAETDNQLEENQPLENANEEELRSELDESINKRDRNSTSSESSTPVCERRLSSVSVSKIEESDAIEILTTSFEEVIPYITEILVSNNGGVIETETVDNNNITVPEFNFKLESVTEETEEELKADGSGRSPMVRRPKHDGLVTMTQTRSLNDLPPHPPKRVGILKKPGTKKDRPLSDSFENLRMVEKQGIVDFYHNKKTEPEKKVEMIRAHSLDELLVGVDRDEGNHSEPSSTSQLSLNGHHDSEDSLTSDLDSPKSRYRSDSDKLSVGSYRASSTLSLNEMLMSRYSLESSLEDLKTIKRGSSLFNRITKKKSKSLTALDMKEKLLDEEGSSYI